MRRTFETVGPWAVLVCALAVPVKGDLITNGGFESGFTGWTTLNQLGSEGTFVAQSGTLSPVNLFAVPSPPGGIVAAMTDSFGPGSHVLYQDFVVPNSITIGFAISFSLFINNANGAPNFFVPATLDFSTPALNQQARIDIIRTSSDPFSVAGADVLRVLYQTLPGNALASGYTNFTADLTTLLQANLGQTLRLRFAEVDNVAPFNMGVDNVSIDAVPEPSTWIMMSGGLLALGFAKRRR